MAPEHLRELANLKLRHPDGALTSRPQTWCSGPIAIGSEIELAPQRRLRAVARGGS